MNTAREFWELTRPDASVEWDALTNEDQSKVTKLWESAQVTLSSIPCGSPSNPCSAP